jgi:hypothetical protein
MTINMAPMPMMIWTVSDIIFDTLLIFRHRYYHELSELEGIT